MLGWSHPMKVNRGRGMRSLCIFKYTNGKNIGLDFDNLDNNIGKLGWAGPKSGNRVNINGHASPYRTLGNPFEIPFLDMQISEIDGLTLSKKIKVDPEPSRSGNHSFMNGLE